MSGPPKSEYPAATGYIANETTNAQSVLRTQKIGNPDPEKRFANLRAAFALRGHVLHRTDPADGPVSLYAERWGLVRYLHDLDDAQRFLAQIGGGHEL